MKGVNKVILLGNVGKDPEIRNTQTGIAVGSFSLATSESWQKDGKPIEKTTWHRCVVWAGLADVVARYVHKGDRLYLEGRLQQSEWEGRDGEKRTTVEIVVTNLLMLGSPRQSEPRQDGIDPSEGKQSRGTERSYDPEPEPIPGEYEDENLPF